MLDEEEILDNLDTAFNAMSPKELFKTWRNLTDALGEEFPVVYNRTEFDEFIDRMPKEEFAKLVKKSPSFDENGMFFSICDGQLHGTKCLSASSYPIWEYLNQACGIIVTKKLTLGSKRLEEAFTEDFDYEMYTLADELEFFFENEFDEENGWEKYVEGCKKVGYDGKNGPFPIEEDDLLEVYWVDTDIDINGYYTDEVSDCFNFQDDWFYFNKKEGQYFSFTNWESRIYDEIGLYEYHLDLLDYIIRTGDDLGIAGVKEILDKNKKYGYVPQKGESQCYY